MLNPMRDKKDGTNREGERGDTYYLLASCSKFAEGNKLVASSAWCFELNVVPVSS